MRKSNWTPSIVPNGDDQNVYLVVDDFRRSGRAWREADVEATDLETVILDMLEGQYKNPVRVVVFNTSEKMVTGRVDRCRLRIATALRSAAARRSVLPAGFCRPLRRPVPRRPAAPADASGLIMAGPRPKPPSIGAKAPFPGFIEPALASSIEKVPTGDRWIHEAKFDGYRVQVHLANAAVKIFTRRGNDWTSRFKKIADDAWHISAGSAIIDGEVIVPSENSVSDFSVLQSELRGRSNKLVLYAFDLLYLNGFDLRKAPLFERKALLRKLIDKTDIVFGENFETDGAATLKHAVQDGARGRGLQGQRQPL
jgi:ATP-dependent DNA ligase